MLNRALICMDGDSYGSMCKGAPLPAVWPDMWMSTLPVFEIVITSMTPGKRMGLEPNAVNKAMHTDGEGDKRDMHQCLASFL